MSFHRGVRCLVGALLTCGAALPGTPALAQAAAPAPVRPQVQEIGLLFAQTAPRGTFERVEGKKNSYKLVLRDVRAPVVWFSDRPARHQGQVPVNRFVASWKGFGFDADPPNAALTILDGDAKADTVIVELRRPRYDRRHRTLTYAARRLPHASGALADHESANDGRVPSHFSDASLFIDDATGSVVNGCVLQPYTKCPGVDLTGAVIGGVNLQGANFTGATLYGAFLYGSTLTAADFSGANLYAANIGTSSMQRAKFRGANMFNVNAWRGDFSNADLTNVWGSQGDFGGANLSNASLYKGSLAAATFQDANLTSADLRQAYLWEANLDGATLTGAGFCNTTMPDLSINSSLCIFGIVAG